MGRSAARSFVGAAAAAFVALSQIPSCRGRALTEERDAKGGASGTGRGGTSAIGGVGSGSANAGGGGVPDAGDSGTPLGGTGGNAGAAGGFAGEASGGMSGSGGDETVPRPALGDCNEPTEWSSNLELCATGFVHRVTASACDPPLRDEDVPNLPANAGVEDLDDCDRTNLGPYASCGMGVDECTRDADCGAERFCLRDTLDDSGEDLTINHRCHSPCRTDADCGTDELCACDYAVQNATRARVTIGTCKPAECRTDAECAVGAERRLCMAPLDVIPNWLANTWPPGGTAPSRLTSFHCQSPDDACFGADSCAVFDPTGYECCPRAVCRFDEPAFRCDAIQTCDPC